MPEIVKCYAIIAAGIDICIFVVAFFLLAYSGMAMESGSKEAVKLSKTASRIMIVTAVLFICGGIIMQVLKILLTQMHCF